MYLDGVFLFVGVKRRIIRWILGLGGQGGLFGEVCFFFVIGIYVSVYLVALVQLEFVFFFFLRIYRYIFIIQLRVFVRFYVIFSGICIFVGIYIFIQFIVFCIFIWIDIYIFMCFLIVIRLFINLCFRLYITVVVLL